MWSRPNSVGVHAGFQGRLPSTPVQHGGRARLPDGGMASRPHSAGPVVSGQSALGLDVRRRLAVTSPRAALWGPDLPQVGDDIQVRGEQARPNPDIQAMDPAGIRRQERAWWVELGSPEALQSIGENDLEEEQENVSGPNHRNLPPQPPSPFSQHPKTPSPDPGFTAIGAARTAGSPLWPAPHPRGLDS